MDIGRQTPRFLDQGCSGVARDSPSGHKMAPGFEYPSREQPASARPGLKTRSNSPDIGSGELTSQFSRSCYQSPDGETIFAVVGRRP